MYLFKGGKNLYAFSFSDCVKATIQKRDFKIEHIFLQSHLNIFLGMPAIYENCYYSGQLIQTWKKIR